MLSGRRVVEPGYLGWSNTRTPKRARAANKDGEFTKRRWETARDVATSFERTNPPDLGEPIDHATMH